MTETGKKRLASAEPLTERHESTLDECFLQLYTLGTIDWPKGAMLTQRSMPTAIQALLINAERARSALQRPISVGTVSALPRNPTRKLLKSKLRSC